MTKPPSDRPLRHLFIIDPLEALLPDKDTTFAFMLECMRRGHEVFTCELHDLFVRDTTPSVRAFPTRVAREPPYGCRDTPITTSLVQFDVVYMRKDPPVDSAYLHTTQILSLVPENRTLVLNNPSALRDANEKLYALNFPQCIPRTLISSDLDQLKAFLQELGGEMIIKPLDGAGGRGVFYLNRDDRNLNALLETATADGRRFIVAQQYIPEVRSGDKRILLLNGAPLGAVLRVPRADDTRSNIHVGGTCHVAEITDSDWRIIHELQPNLSANGLYFVGIDVIGDYLTEVNVTSPTGIQEIDRLEGGNLSARVLDFITEEVDRRIAGA